MKWQLASDSQHKSFEGSLSCTDRSKAPITCDLFVLCCNFTHWFISTVRLSYSLYLGSEKKIVTLQYHNIYVLTI